MEIAKSAMVCFVVFGVGACGGVDEGWSGSAHEHGTGVEDASFGELGFALRKAASADVTFEGCSEFVGLAFVPRNKVRNLVPSDYDLATFTTDAEAVLVVRAVDCERVRVGREHGRSGRVVQIGAILSNMNSGSDIDNYTLWYVTDNAKLQRELSRSGVPAEYSGGVHYTFSPDDDGFGSLAVSLCARVSPNFVVSGDASVPTDAAVPFQASWWYDGTKGTVQMETVLPAIQFGVAHTTLTAVDAPLKAIVGSSPITFPGLDSYNTFGLASMSVLVH